jgi:hypothetical protein
VTYGEAYGPAMEITVQEVADGYFERLVRWSMEQGGLSREEAEEVERQNLGYYAGYYGPEVRARVERLFRCAHPFFGAIAEKGQPTPDEAFEMGRLLAEGRLTVPLPGPREQRVPSRRFDL